MPRGDVTVQGTVSRILTLAYTRDGAAGKSWPRHHLEHVAEVVQEIHVVAGHLAGAVAHLGDRLAVATDQLHDDLQCLVATVVRQTGADAEAGLHPVAEMPVEAEGIGQVQSIAEDEPLGGGIDAQPPVVSQRLFSPLYRVAGIVAQSVEQLAEIEIERASCRERV